MVVTIEPSELHVDCTESAYQWYTVLVFSQVQNSLVPRPGQSLGTRLGTKVQ